MYISVVMVLVFVDLLKSVMLLGLFLKVWMLLCIYLRVVIMLCSLRLFWIGCFEFEY